MFPGESADYRAARDALLEAEVALRANIESVAAMRRSLPLGGQADDYEFDKADGPVRLSELFTDGKDSLLLYSYMFGPADNQPCPLCSAFIDSLQGSLPHIRERMNVAVVARAPIKRFAALAAHRGWHNVPILSAAGNTYAQDYRTEVPGEGTETGRQLPMCNVFVKRSGKVYHYWASEMLFAPSEWDARHVDLLWPLWHFFDLTPEGRGDFYPRLSYNADHAGKAGKA